jgi:large subunit ribosomal protein L2
MALKNFNPVTPSLRGTVLINRAELWKGKPVKSLVEGLSKNGGRGNSGRITTRGQGGGHKKAYRLIDFRRNKDGVQGVVERVETHGHAPQTGFDERCRRFGLGVHPVKIPIPYLPVR